MNILFRNLPAILFLSIASAHGASFDYHSVRGRFPSKPETLMRYEGESDFSLEGTSRRQDMSGFGSQWSDNAHLLWHGEIGAQARCRFSIARQSVYRLSIRLTQAPDYGRFEILLDGEVIKTDVDLYAPRVRLTDVISLGERPLNQGEHRLQFKLTGSHPEAKPYRKQSYLMGFDYLHLEDLQPVPPTRQGSYTEPEPGLDSVPLLPFESAKALLAKHCYHCHGKEKTKGDLNLQSLESEMDFEERLQLSARVADALQFRNMPPDDEPQLSGSDHQALTHFFQSLVDRSLESQSQATPIVMRRLNRFDYNNAVRDLLHLKGDLYPLPEKVIRESSPYFDPASGRFPRSITAGNRTLGKNVIEKPILTGVAPFAMDLPAEHGFNNRGAELSISPILLETFLKLGRSVLESPQFDEYCEQYQSVFAPPASDPATSWSDIARTRLAALMERAFRQQLDINTIDRFHHFFESRLAATGDFADSMKAAVAGILASPRFLFINESVSPPGVATPLGAYELATRLSFFLWSSIPDAELLRKARNGSLTDAAALSGEVSRMLESPKSRALSTNFARQWLRLDQLMTAVPDFDRFERYYSRIGCEQWKFGLQTMVEPILLFESIMVEDRSIMLLVDSNYTYRSDELQSWYQDRIPFEGKANRNRFNTFSQTYRRHPLDNRREGGVITSSAVLTMTSSPLRTSPITRGSWIASVIFNQPPPPPPDVVPEIEADDAAIEARGLTLRQRLVQHQVDDHCASCHSKIDPFGFALENFDPVGRWRDRYRSGLPIDSSGELFGQASFADIVEFKDAILENPEWFTRAFCEHLLSYALGRKLELTDKPAIDRMLRRALAARGQFSVIVREIVMSYPFRYRQEPSQ